MGLDPGPAAPHVGQLNAKRHSEGLQQTADSTKCAGR